MKGAVPALVYLALLAGCRKDQPSPSAPTPSAEALADRARPVVDEPVADEIAEAAPPASSVDEALVVKYLGFREKVLERAQTVVAQLKSPPAGKEADVDARMAASVRMQERTKAWGEQMRAVEESARKELGLSRDEVVAVGQVVTEVLSVRQVWKMSGGDEAVTAARADLARLSQKDRAAAQAALAKKEEGFAVMRDARSARKRFGDKAVDAVLAHEDALWKVQREGSKLLSEVY
jgi:hypothetical protein